MHRCLIVANQTLGGEALEALVRERISRQTCEFYVLVPATRLTDWALAVASLPEAGLWTLPVEDERSREAALERLDAELARLREAGATCDGEVGDPDPLLAVRDVLTQRQIDEIIVSTLPERISRWLRLDLPSRLERAFELPVTHVTGSTEVKETPTT